MRLEISAWSRCASNVHVWHEDLRNPSHGRVGLCMPVVFLLSVISVTDKKDILAFNLKESPLMIK